MPIAGEAMRDSITHSLPTETQMCTLKRTGPISLKLYIPLPHKPKLHSWTFITEQQKTVLT